jgi:hypothetical protein
MKNIILLTHSEGGLIEMEEKMIENSVKYKEIKNNWKDISLGSVELRMESNIINNNFLNLEFSFCNELKNFDIETVLKLFYESDFYKLWLPSVSESKTVILT